jgi:hypothetical protein
MYIEFLIYPCIFSGNGSGTDEDGWSIAGMILMSGNQSTLRKTSKSVTLTTNPINEMKLTEESLSSQRKTCSVLA